MTFKRTSILVAAATLLSGSSLASVAPSVHAQLSAKDKTIVLGQPPVVVLEISSTSIGVIDLGGNRIGNLEFTVIEPSGHTITAKLAIPDFTTTGKINLFPGAPYRQPINLASLFRSYKAGRYLISAKVLAPDSSKVVAMARPIALRVEPMSVNTLKAVCDKLTREIESASSAEDRSEPATELASIHDPIVVDDIKSLLGKGLGVDDELITSLQQIGNSNAIDALRMQLHNPDPDTARSARSALALIEKNTKIVALRLLALRALEQ